MSLIDDYIIGYNPCLLLEKGIPMKTFMIKVAYQLENSYYERICLEILRQVSNALGYLHRSNVLHTDIRIEHLILVGNVVKVIDFSNAIAIEHEKREEIFNEQDNRSPEEYKNMIMTQKTDVWQLGIMAFGMIRKNQINTLALAQMNQSELTQIIKCYTDVYSLYQLGKIVECALVINPARRLLPLTISRRIESMNGIVNLSDFFVVTYTTADQILISDDKPEHHFVYFV